MTVTATLPVPCPTVRTVGVPPVVTSAPGSLSAKTRVPHQEQVHSWHTLPSLNTTLSEILQKKHQIGRDKILYLSILPDHISYVYCVNPKLK